jgi:hypothetical protein
MNGRTSQLPENDWVQFPGGELEGQRPRALCPDCRRKLSEPSSELKRAPLCFQCYRAEIERQHALHAAGNLNTASEERFQSTLPFEPVNYARLETLRADRATARAELRSGPGQFVDRRHRAQIAARHALQRIANRLRARQVAKADGDRVMLAAFHAAELQLPDAWLPFVVSR